jgi:hypothetical protein
MRETECSFGFGSRFHSVAFPWSEDMRVASSSRISRCYVGGKQPCPSFSNCNPDFIGGILGHTLRVCQVSKDEFKYMTLDNLSTIVPLGVHGSSVTRDRSWKRSVEVS